MAERQYWTSIENQERKKPTIFYFLRDEKLNSRKEKPGPLIKGPLTKRAILLFGALKALSLVERVL